MAAEYGQVVQHMRGQKEGVQLPRETLRLTDGTLLQNIIPLRIVRAPYLTQGDFVDMLWLAYLDENDSTQRIPMCLIEAFGISYGIGKMKGKMLVTFTYHRPADGILPEPPSKIRYVQPNSAICYGTQPAAHPDETSAYWIEGSEMGPLEPQGKKFPFKRIGGLRPEPITRETVYSK
ncbi:MAG: hypothetical protein WC775_00270 [Patescibacteria group bacterium]|jgi:hypothetical protein